MVMDFSSIICLSRSPKCNICPIEKNCNKYFSLKKSRRQEDFTGSDREKRGKILKKLVNSKELHFTDVQELVRADEYKILPVLEKMEKDRLVHINKKKKIVKLTKE